MPFFLILLLTASTLLQGELIDIQKYNDNIELDFRYAQEDNFANHPFYPCQHIYVDAFVAKALTRVQRELAKEGMGLTIYEAYRPASVQTLLDKARQEYQMEVYFNDAPHYRKGLGVDVGIYYLDGQILALPTPWGMDCAEAYQDYPYHSAMVFHNKALLEKVMRNNGFEPLRERWWHFDLKGYEMAPDLEIEPTQYPCAKVF